MYTTLSRLPASQAHNCETCCGDSARGASRATAPQRAGHPHLRPTEDEIEPPSPTVSRRDRLTFFGRPSFGAATASIAARHFTKLGIQLGLAPTQVQRWFAEVTTRYREPQRHYHTIEHIESMLVSLAQVQHRAVDLQVIVLAIFFHDVVYAPTRSDNEAQSQTLFLRFATDAQFAPARRDAVLHLIDRTVHHDAASPQHPDLALFLDLDLGVLSSPEKSYLRYAAQIRREYAHVPRASFCAQRATILGSFLQKGPIYASEAFADRESQARRNVAAEIVRLQNGELDDGFIRRDERMDLGGTWQRLRRKLTGQVQMLG